MLAKFKHHLLLARADFAMFCLTRYAVWPRWIGVPLFRWSEYICVAYENSRKSAQK